MDVLSQKPKLCAILIDKSGERNDQSIYSKKKIALIAVLSALVGTFSIAQAADDDWPPKVTSDGLTSLRAQKRLPYGFWMVLISANTVAS